MNIKETNPKRYFIIRNDDPCALSNAVKERKILSVFEKYNIPQVFAVVPQITEDPHDCDCPRVHPLEENPEMVSLLKEYAGKGLVEIAQHGFTHQTNAHYPSHKSKGEKRAPWKGIDRQWLAFNPVKGEYSEFKGLSRSEKELRIRQGKEYLEKLFETKIETFVFPWNTADKETIDILRDCGFKNVLCGPNDFYNIKNLNTISHSREDFLEFPAPLEAMQQVKGQVLFHICYHSWMLEAPDIQYLDTLLKTLVSNEKVEFVATKDLDQCGREFKKMLRFSNFATILSLQANRFLRKRIPLESFYVFNRIHYFKKIARAIPVVLIVQGIGLRRALFLTAAAFIVFVLGEFYFRNGLVDIVPFILLLGAFMIMLVINLRIMLSKRGVPGECCRNSI